MNEVASLIADLVTAAVDPNLIGRVAAALAKSPAESIDGTAEKRRLYDRERKRQKRNSTGIPPDNADTGIPQIPPEFHRNSTGHEDALARVRDNNPSTVVSGSERKKGSEAKASAEIPQIGDPDKLAWRDALALLMERTGASRDTAAAFFGKLLRENRIEARDMLSAVNEAIANGTQDPKSFLVKAAQARAKRRLNDDGLTPHQRYVRSNII